MRSFQNLRKQSVITPADENYLLTHTLTDGKGFPPSYIAFATQLGWGKLCDLFLVYVPLGQYADSWLIQSRRIKNFMDEFYAEIGDATYLLEPDGYQGIEAVLLPFGMSENGEYLAWDIAHRNANGELPIYVLAARFGGIRYGATDLYQFIEKCTDHSAVKDIFGPGYKSLPPIFEPITIVS